MNVRSLSSRACVVSGSLLHLSCLLVAACKQEGGHAAADGGGTTTTTTNAATAKLPSDFPEDLPVYPGAEIASNKTGTAANGKPSRTVVLTTSDPVAKVRAFYAPGQVKKLTFHLGEGRPDNAFWYTDTHRGIDVKVSVYGGRKGTEVELKENPL
jgi:hypothetical protein